MIIGNHQLRIRPLIKEDAPFLAKWLSDPAVLEFYEGRDNPFDLNKVVETFYKQEDTTNRCLIEWEDQAIGYIQYYVIDDEERVEYELQEVEGIVFGLDQFIGEERYRDKGIGTLLIQTMVEYLKKKEHVHSIVMDPQIQNHRALACYEKCGFTKQKLLPSNEWHEGEYRDCWLIQYTV
ncbi:GNAT family N-acetyltransferase [Alkalicoccobacillus gibsonii]|uniref:GNAT family N-acetyltransferase n=1 Tax=Alkalicoccobacillus gibsonii TaxID=79881 RepID=UPI003F7C735C